MNEAVRATDGTAIKDKEPAVFLHAIERRYHQGAATLEILKGAELAVWPGQSVALIAPSGTGKSTLLHIAGLLEHPDAGEVYVDGTATSGLSDAEQDRKRQRDGHKQQQGFGLHLTDCNPVAYGKVYTQRSVFV